jgi:Domain of unknown function (DUF4296)
MKRLFVIIGLSFFIGCANKKSSKSGILGKQKMQAVLWDIIGADVFTTQFVKKDSLKNAPLENMQLQNKIFALHKVSRDDFYKSYNYYSNHTDMMIIILDSMTAKAQRDRSKVMENHYKEQSK